MATKTIILAGGCFWCTQQEMLTLNGVTKALCVYIGKADLQNQPTYNYVCSPNNTNIKEAVEVTYNSSKVSLSKVLQHFFVNIDPTTKNKQFFDVGVQYQTAIFYNNLAEKQEIEDLILYINSLNLFNTAVQTQVLPITTYWYAEDYHQDFYLKNPQQYNAYKTASNKTAITKKLWQNFKPK